MLSLLKNIRVEPQAEVELVQERCLRRRLHSCACRLCLDVCASGALIFADRQLRLDLQKCTGCMCCTAVCPSEALVAEYDMEEVLRKVQEGPVRQQLVISCIRKKQLSADEIAVPCLGIFAEESLLALGMSGCQAAVFNLTGCSVCENRQAAALFLTILHRVRDVAAEVLNTDLSVAKGRERDTTGGTADRRSFLSSLRADLAILAGGRREVRPTLPGKSSGRRIPLKVKFMNQAVAAATVESRAQLLALCTHRLIAGPACNNCPLCTGICPTGALRIDGSGEDKQLLFTSTRCSGCGLCVSFCKKAALSLFFSPLSGREPVEKTIP